MRKLKAQKLSNQSRLEYIRNELAKSGEVRIENLAKILKVSQMTIRRDLDLLESKGEVVRTYGGATSAQRLTFEFTFRSRQQENLDVKRRLAQQALKHIKDNQTIILDTGTTILEIARAIRGKRKAKIITTSLAVVSELQFDNDIEIILLGGFLRDNSPDLHGPLTEQNLEQFQADIVFMGADAINHDGTIYTDDLKVRNLDLTMAEIAKTVIIVADSSKFGKTAMCKIIKPKKYDILITDKDANPKIIKRIQKSNVVVELV